MGHQDTTGLIDILLVGAGFSGRQRRSIIQTADSEPPGIYQLYYYRKLGYSVRVFEAAPDLGGTWYSNRYPGARVDSDHPHYQLSLPELWQDWTWRERYPGQLELLEYFKYVDKKLDVKKDVSFNTRVVSASFDQQEERWIVVTENGLVVRPRFFVLCVGFAAKSYTPDFKGLDKFEGVWYHSSKWPQEGVDLKNKRVGVIGTGTQRLYIGRCSSTYKRLTGASGVQVIQEVGPEAAHLTVFQRTPNLALPMRQKKLDAEVQAQQKIIYPTLFRRRLQTGSKCDDLNSFSQLNSLIDGFSYDRYPKPLFSATLEERLLRWEDLWAQGGFHFTGENFNDYSTNEDANREIYNFWRDKVRLRINDPKLQEKLAPTIPPHPLGAKRASLEQVCRQFLGAIYMCSYQLQWQSYFEVFNQKNVTLVDLNDCGISEMTSKGIMTEDGVEHELDVLVLATGFDSVTGSLTQIDIRGVDGVTIAEKWKEGVHTYLGLCSVGFPNMFFTYGPQAPTAFSNGPTCIVRPAFVLLFSC